MRYLALLVFSLLLSGCASLSKEECQQLNWQARGVQDVERGYHWQSAMNRYTESCAEHNLSINREEYMRGVKYAGAKKCSGQPGFHDGKWSLVGRQDALAGKTRGNFDNYVAACSQYEVVPEKTAYLRGFSKGLAGFCTADNGLELGRSGKEYKHTCSGTAERKFMRGYKVGQKLREAEELRTAAEQAKADADAADAKVVEQEKRVQELAEKIRNFTKDTRPRVYAAEDDVRAKERALLDARRGKTTPEEVHRREDELLKAKEHVTLLKRQLVQELENLKAERGKVAKELIAKRAEAVKKRGKAQELAANSDRALRAARNMQRRLL